jgi:copper/silver efflux system protein
VVWRGSREVGSAVLTAISTTIISFLPVFTMTGPEGKMFTPLAYTKTFVLLASVALAVTVVPSLIHLAMGRRDLGKGLRRRIVSALPLRARPHAPVAVNVAVAVLFVAVLASVWEPLGPGAGGIRNFLFAGGLVALVLGAFTLVHRHYAGILGWALRHKALFLALPGAMVVLGLFVWLGFGRVLGFVPAGVDRMGLDGDRLRLSAPWVWVAHEFPGLGREFMPPLDEGSFLWMPTTMPHASLGEALEVLQYQDHGHRLGAGGGDGGGEDRPGRKRPGPGPRLHDRDGHNYKPEYVTDSSGRRVLFRYDRRQGEFVRDDQGELIPDRRGRPYRQWRDHIRSPQDIWNEIAEAAHLPGTTSAPKLQPIETRLVMLQTGMRAPMGIKLRAPDLETLDRMAVELERLVREVPTVRRETVNAERVMGKPYLEIDVDRRAIARYGLAVTDVQRTIAASIGGMTVTTTVEGRERYPVRVRYAREQRSELEDLEQVLIPAMDGTLVPLAQVAEIAYVRGPDMIRSEDTFLTAYVTFSGLPEMAEVEVVESVQAYLDAKVASGDLVVPAGVSWRFSGTYENQLHAAETLRVVLPLALAIILLILYFQFRSLPTTLMIFSGIAVAWAGGFVMIYFYGQDWFLNFAVFGVNLRELFQLHAINLSVAVWVGFLALFGIAVDDGVLMATYLSQRFRKTRPDTVEAIREETVYAGLRRVRPALMTSATTVLALLPVLTSTGRGADVMIPMAIPTVGGMTLAVVTMFTVPVLWSWWEEAKLRRGGGATPPSGPAGPDPRSG